MNIKNITQFVLFVLLCSSCFNSNLHMVQGDEKEIVNNNKVELNPVEVYDEFVNLVDDPRVSIDGVMKFLDEDNRIQCLLNSSLPFVHYVVESGEYELLKEILERYDKHDLANYKGGDWECTPLHTAAREEDISMVKLLLDKGSQVNVLDSKGSTVLDYLCYNTTAANVIDIFKVIVSNNSPITGEDGCTVLHVATLANNIDLVKYVIFTYPEMLNMKSKDGLTALHLSVGLGYADIFEIIIHNQEFDKDSIAEDINDLIDIAKKRNNQFMITELQKLQKLLQERL